MRVPQSAIDLAKQFEGFHRVPKADPLRRASAHAVVPRVDGGATGGDRAGASIEARPEQLGLLGGGQRI